jgi:malic enzyme
VVSGAGSAALACANLYVLLGINPDNIIMFDKDGVIRLKGMICLPCKKNIQKETELPLEML